MSKLRLNGTTSGYTELSAADTAGNNTFVLPSADGTSGQVLSTDGSGNLSWAAAGGTKIEVGNTKAEVTDTGSNGTFAVTTEGTQRLTVDSSGRVGIGTATPGDYYADKLVIDIGASAQDGLTIVSGSTANGMIAFADGTAGNAAYRGYLNYNHADDYLNFHTAAVERMRITNDGRVGINTTNYVNGRLIVGSDCSVVTTAVFDDFLTGSSSSNIIGIRRNGTFVGNISTTNTSTAYNTSSDYRLKENVVPLTGAIERVNQLQVHRFNFIADPDKTVDGFIAHEAQAIVPECVTGEKDAVDEDGNPVYQGIDQSKLVPLITAALQEALQKIETQGAAIAALEAANTDLAARITALEAN
jgi:hypothetical protein